VDASRDDLTVLLGDPVSFFDHADADLRRLALSACAEQADQLVSPIGHILATDPEPRVRAEAAEVLGFAGARGLGALDRARDDPDAIVVEAVATAYGEIDSTDAVPWLVAEAVEAEDRLVREAAVAALGAIGDDRAVPALLELIVSGPPQVRRRCVVALTAFDDPRIEPALEAAIRDRNPGVREAAGMVLGQRP
jgi:HEAT repeat protein